MTQNNTVPTDNKTLIDWLNHHNIDEVECLIPDMTGIARGKIIPRDKFIDALTGGSLFIPDSIFNQLVTGHECQRYWITDEGRDTRVLPDPKTVRMVPWYTDNPVAQIVCDIATMEGETMNIAPRQVLKNLLQKYADLGLRPVVAPELEFYYVERNTDPSLSLNPPTGLSGRKETGAQAYGIEALNDFDPFVETIYDYAESSRLDLDGILHESGMAQMEINMLHGDALELADQVFLFKRTVRQAALHHDHHATFMARPYDDQPGSAMHMHQSVFDMKTNKNIFATDDGGRSDALMHYIGGLQNYLLDGSAILFPNVNSYRRIVAEFDAPINLEWGTDNRSAGLRIPNATGNGTRIENRLAGADANPYLMMAWSLSAGLLGMQNKTKPSAEVQGDAYDAERKLSSTLYGGMQRMRDSDVIEDMLGKDFIHYYLGVKEEEVEAFNKIVTSWEREHLLLNV